MPDCRRVQVDRSGAGRRHCPNAADRRHNAQTAGLSGAGWRPLESGQTFRRAGSSQSPDAAIATEYHFLSFTSVNSASTTFSSFLPASPPRCPPPPRRRRPAAPRLPPAACACGVHDLAQLLRGLAPAPRPCASSASFVASFCFSSSSASLIAASILRLLVGADLVAVLAERLLHAVHQRVELVARLHGLELLAVFLGVRLGVLDHLLDLVLGQARVRLDLDLVFLAGRLVLGRHVQDAVGVDVERDLDLRHAARRRRNALEVELAEALVARRARRARPAARGSSPPSGCRRRSRTPAAPWSGSSCSSGSAWSSRRPASRCRATAASRRAAARP